MASSRLMEAYRQMRENRVKALEEALRWYGQHKHDCKPGGTGESCSCGWDEAAERLLPPQD